jgi:hypothetical protein
MFEKKVGPYVELCPSIQYHTFQDSELTYSMVITDVGYLI